MGFEDVVSRADLLINKYAKYDTGEDKNVGMTKSKDYDVVYKHLREQLENLQKITEELSSVAIPPTDERAAVLNADLRRNKLILMEGIEEARGLVTKGDRVTKGIIAERNDEIDQLIHKALQLPDDIRIEKSNVGISFAKRTIDPKHKEAIREQETSGAFNPPVYIKGLKTLDSTETEEAKDFREEWDTARRRQDERLEALREELESVSEVAGRISNTINQQKVVMECLEERADNNLGSLDNQNKRLKGAVERMSGPLKCCCYTFLFLVLIGVGGYAYAYFAGLTLKAIQDDAMGTPTPLPTPTPTPSPGDILPAAGDLGP